jgi:predicted HTH domain antitoxin
MSAVQLDLEDELVSLLRQTNQPIQAVAREFIVLELYRRGTVSSGKAAGWLGMSRLSFINYASRLGIPYFDLTADEWEAERTSSKAL